MDAAAATIHRKERRMSVDEKLALLKTAIVRLKEKYCENCQEYDCDYCRFEVDEDETD